LSDDSGALILFGKGAQNCEGQNMTGKSDFGTAGQNGYLPREMAFSAIEFVLCVSIFPFEGQVSFSDPLADHWRLITVDLY
jgi:hypothetical protein